MKIRKLEKIIPTVPFRVLDAPNLKDDYYCSILAYCYTSQTLAVALTHKVYLWTEAYGVRCPPLPATRPSNFVTSLAFSSDNGAKSILAVARHNGSVTLWGLLETSPRFEAPHPCPASCVAFRPTVTERRSSQLEELVPCEDLIIGDDSGRIYYYSIEWPDIGPGSMTLLIKLNAHSQNICGLAWAPDGAKFVSGGNDNVALLFAVDAILDKVAQPQASESNEQDLVESRGRGISRYARNVRCVTPPTSPERSYIQRTPPHVQVFDSADPTDRGALPLSPPHSAERLPQPPHIRTRQRRRAGQGPVLRNRLADPAIPGTPNLQTFVLYHAAAVKAVAFAPWQANLLATGGGSNDRQIHFYHTSSGAALAVINVFAQVTSLV